jgi:hypothetical protein
MLKPIATNKKLTKVILSKIINIVNIIIKIKRIIAEVLAKGFNFHNPLLIIIHEITSEKSITKVKIIGI